MPTTTRVMVIFCHCMGIFSCTSWTFIRSSCRKESNSTWHTFHICHESTPIIPVFIDTYIEILKILMIDIW